ncbi:phospholipid-transporting ATPase ABCA3-like [Ixodes scapularis]
MQLTLQWCVFTLLTVSATVLQLSSGAPATTDVSEGVQISIKLPEGDEVVKTDVPKRSAIPACLRQQPGTVEDESGLVVSADAFTNCAKTELTRLQTEINNPDTDDSSEEAPEDDDAPPVKKENTSFWYTSSPLGFHRQDVGLVCLSMVLEGVLLFALLSCLDSGIHVFRYSPHSPTPTSSSENLDANVKKEKEAVRKMCSTGDFKGVAVAVDDLSKWYGRRHAVRGLSFALKNHQCLGLLGVNGAGKTTVLQMLSGIVPSSNGEAHMQGFTLSRNRRAWQSNIGYCPQYDGLMNRLTAYEQLRLFARLRGVPPGLVERAVTRVVWMVGLEEWACKQCFTYSGGNKRKLSLAMAIIGVPKLLLLDEPLSGVDAIVRRRIVTGLRLAMESLDVAVVFGTHSVQECEALCDTVGVMAAGELKFLGSFGSLKERFQTGCIVRFKLNVDDQQSSLAAAVSKELPGIDLRDAHEGTLVFHLKQGIPWSVLFDKLDRLRETFAIEEAIVSDMTSGHALSTLSSGESDALSFGRS